MLKAGIMGSTGYTGHELIELLKRHPAVEIVFAASASSAGSDLIQAYPGGPAQALVAPDEVDLSSADVAFLCVPHGSAAPWAKRAIEAGARVIDLSADFRLSDPQVFKSWYGVEHAAPELLDNAVYGLTEWAREDLPEAQLVANPGCYPTSVLLPLLPLVQAGALSGTVVVDSKSGVTGAGRRPRPHTQFAELSENLVPYALGRAHRHVPEMEQALAWASPTPPGLIFSPHLLPVARGILSTIYAPLAEGWDEALLRQVLTGAYADEVFVELLPPGDAATLAHVVRSNRCVMGVVVSEGTAIITSAIDNLLKGAAGQAVQNMNAVFGLDETLGVV